MKIVYKNGDRYVIRFDHDEEVLKTLIDFAEKEGIGGASFTAIGAVKKTVIAYYEIEKKEYLDKTFDEEMEIITVTGNIAKNKEMGNIVVHAHGSFGNIKFKVFGGHVMEMVVSATCELMLTKYDGGLSRTLHKDVGLNLLN